MTNYVEHLFLYLLVIHVYSLVKHLFISFACVLSCLFILSSFETYLDVLNRCLFQIHDLQNSFPQFVACLFLNSVSQEKFLTSMKSSVSMFSFMDCTFALRPKKSLSDIRSQRFSPVFNWKFKKSIPMGF